MKHVDVAAEWRLLGALTQASNSNVIDLCTPKLFTLERVNVFNAIRACYEKYGQVSREGIKQMNAGVYPGELSALQVVNIDPHAVMSELARLARKRQTARLAQTLLEKSEEFDPAIDSVLSSISDDPILATRDSSLIPGIRALSSEIERKRNGQYRYVRTGFKFLDNAFGGEWCPGTLVFYLGSPGGGKTTLAAQSALMMGRGFYHGDELIQTPSLTISIEMDRKHYTSKWLASDLNIDQADLLQGKLTDAQMARKEELELEYQQLPIYIVDDDDLTYSQIVAEIRRHVQKYKVRVVFIDYFQIIPDDLGTGNANVDLGRMAREFKALARRYNITIVLLSQVTDGNIGQFRIRNSGEAPQSADVIVEGILEENDPSMNGVRGLQIKFHKNRLGRSNNTTILFNSPYQRFEEAVIGD